MGASHQTKAQPDTEYVLLQVAAPSRPVRNIAVLLLDPKRDYLYMRFADSWQEFAEEGDVELLSALPADFQSQAAEEGGEKFLESLEDTLSNFLRVSPRTALPTPTDFKRKIDDLFAAHVLHRV